MNLVDPGAVLAKKNAEKGFIVKDLKGAIMMGTIAQSLDPNVDGIDEALIAYKIHLAASSTKCSSGETNWYRVLGVKEGFDDIESIKKQYKKLVAMMNPTKNASVATVGAFRRVNKAWSKLCDPNKQKVSFLNQQAHGVKVSKMACPRCRKWCKYETPKVSSGHKYGRTKRESVSLITCSTCRCKFDPLSGQTPNSRFSRSNK